MAGKESFIYKTVEVSKKIDIVTVGFGVVAGSAPVVFFGMLSYIASDAIQDRFERSKYNSG